MKDPQAPVTTDLGSFAFRIRWLVLGMTSLVLILNYADRAALGVSGSTIMAHVGLSKTEFGLISSIFFVGYAPFCFIGGWLSDKYGPRKVMGAAVAWWSIFSGLTALGGSYLGFLIIRFLFGFGEGPQGSVTVKTMRNWFPQRQMGLSVGISQGCTPLGGVIGTPLVAALIATSGDWRLPFVVLGLFGVLVSIGWWLVVRDNPGEHPWAGQVEAEELRSDAASHALSTDRGTAPPVRYYIVQPLVLATSFAFFAYAWVLYTFLSWFPVYLADAHGLVLKQVAWAGTIPWALGVVGYMLGGAATDWIGSYTGKPAAARKGMIIFGLLGTTILLGCIAFVVTTTAAVLLMSGIVFLLYMTGSQYFLVISDCIRAERLGGVVGFVHFLANLAGIIAPVLVGIIVDQTKSWLLTFGVSGLICFFGVIVMVLWARTDRQIDIPAET